MAATLAVFLGVRLAFTYAVRQYLVSPRHLSTSLDSVAHGFGSSNGGPDSLFLSASNLPNEWVYSTKAVDASGHGLTTKALANACPDLVSPQPVPTPGGSIRITAPGGADDPLTACVTKLSSTYHGVVTYQPANRYWLFQCLETGIFLVAALALAGLCFYWLRRRAS
jgi:hypothetical protein